MNVQVLTKFGYFIHNFSVFSIQLSWLEQLIHVNFQQKSTKYEHFISEFHFWRVLFKVPYSMAQMIRLRARQTAEKRQIQVIKMFWCRQQTSIIQISCIFPFKFHVNYLAREAIRASHSNTSRCGWRMELEPVRQTLFFACIFDRLLDGEENR